MKLQIVENVDYARSVSTRSQEVLATMPDLERLETLTEANKEETLGLLQVRPVHTVVMTSFINDNGIESENNRGKFYGYRNSEGKLEGVALIGHTTLVEAHSNEALVAFAMTARNAETPIKVMMSDGDSIERFWELYAVEGQKPLHNFKELLFELSMPFMVQQSKWEVRPAKAEELEQVAQAQAEVAFIESGIDPMEKDREGFLKRCLKRIEKGRTFIAVENGKVVFKVDLVAETENTAYLEGYYVASEMRGNGIGHKCLAKVGLQLLDRFENVCGLSNVKFENVHGSLAKAGFQNTDYCRTIFV